MLKHLTVTLNGAPCILLKSAAVAPEGILLPVAAGEEPTLFVIDRKAERYPVTYTRRRAGYAIARTAEFLGAPGLADMAHIELVKRALAAKQSTSLKWEIQVTKWPSRAQVIADAVAREYSELFG